MSQSKVLIVEDELIVAADLKASLETAGFEVIDNVITGEEAIEIIGRDKPDLIIMDIQLKGTINGVETAQLIKDNYRIPVIFLTSNSNQSTIEKAKLVEPYGYLLKPVKGKELFVAIHTALYKHKMEENLARQKQFFETLFDNSPIAIVSADINNKVENINKKFTQLFGYQLEDIKGRNIEDFFLPEDKNGESSKIASGVLKGEIETTETVRLTKANRPVDVELSGAPIIINGEPLGILLLYQDITRRKTAQKKLQKIHSLYRETIENANGIPYQINFKDNRFEFIGKGFYELFGIAQDGANPEDVYKKYKEVIILSNQDIDSFDEYLQRFKTGKLRDFHVDFRTVGKGGQVTWISDFSVPVIDENTGTVIGAQGIWQNITQRKRIEKQVNEEAARAQNYLDIAGVLIITLDLDWNVTLINQKGSALLQDEQSEIIGKNWLSFIDKKDRTRVNQELNDILENKVQPENKIEYQICSRNGISSILAWHHRILYNEEGAITGILASGEDITAIKESQKKLINLYKEIGNKKEELEEIIYVTSHDLRSPLLNISGFTNEMLDGITSVRETIQKSGLDTATREEIEKIFDTDINEASKFIRSSINKIENLLRGLLELSRLGRSVLTIKKINMNDLISEVLNNFEYQIKNENIAVRVEKLPECYGDYKLLNQLFSNLIGNAIKYLSSERSGEIIISGELNSNDVFYHVQDNGIGIPPKSQNKIFKIFERLYTNQKEGEGLGLTIVKRILEKHDGHIRLKSSLGEGSTFSVSLPAVDWIPPEK